MNLLIIRTRTLLLKLCITILALGASLQAEAQYWEYYTILGLNAPEDINALTQLKNDRGYLMVGRGPDNSSSTLDPDVFIARFDIDGRFLWKKYIDNYKDTRALDVVESEDGQIFLVGEGREDVSANNYDIFVLSLNPKGDVIWSYSTNTEDIDERSHAIDVTLSNELIIAGQIKTTATVGNGAFDAYFMKLDAAGNLVWEKNMGLTGDDVAYDVTVNNSGQDDEEYVFTGSLFMPQSENLDIFLSIVNDNDDDPTNPIVETYYLQLDDDKTEEAYSIDLAYDENEERIEDTYIIAGLQVTAGESSDLLYTSVKPEPSSQILNTEWFQLFEADSTQFAIEAKRVKYVSGEKYAILALEEKSSAQIGMRLIEFNGVTGDTIATESFNHLYEDTPDSFIPKDLVVRPNLEGYAISGDKGLLALNADPFFFRTGPIGLTYTGTISGKVFKDNNEDCGFDDGTDIPLKNWRIEARNQEDGRAFIGTSDEEGNYTITVDPGTYDIFYALKNDHWEALSTCSTTITDTLINENENIQFDVPVKTNSNCEFDYLEINASTLGVDCEAEEVDYTIDITNYGPTTSSASTIEIVLDEKFTFITASIPATLDNNIVSVDIDELNINESTSFTLNLGTNCEDVLELEAYRLEARIKDAELCDPSGGYNDGSFSVDISCDSENEGKAIVNIFNNTEASVQLANYIIIEDIYVGRITPDTGGPITIPGNGNTGNPFVDTLQLANDYKSTLRVIVPQPQDHPGRSIPTNFLEGCVDVGEDYNTGYVLNFLENDGDGFTAIDVQENKALPTGNFMEAVPRGLTDDNSISSESAIKYRIYFKNNSDTPSEYLTIRDTLPAAATILQEGASSHKFNYDLYENNVARFTLDQSETVLAGEQGFLEFKVFFEQEATPCEAIENSALIIFENQELIYTNSINTELCGSYAEFVDLVDTPISPEQEVTKLNIYPNPFIDYSIIELEGEDIYFWSIELYDINGKMVRRVDSDSEQLVLQRNGLESGMYIVKVLSDEQIIKTGKLMVH